MVEPGSSSGYPRHGERWDGDDYDTNMHMERCGPKPSSFLVYKIVCSVRTQKNRATYSPCKWRSKASTVASKLTDFHKRVSERLHIVRHC